MGYLYFQVSAAQQTKQNQTVCGDVRADWRTTQATYAVCADGIGSGVKAHIAATLTVNRIRQLTEGDLSFRDVFIRVVRTMNEWRSPELPYTAFSMVRALPDGQCTVLGCDAPGAVEVRGCEAEVLKRREFFVGQTPVYESHTHLRPGEMLILMSDGISQAGLGNGWAHGWGEEGVCRSIRQRLKAQEGLRELPSDIVRQATRLGKFRAHDDQTVVGLLCRPGTVVNVLTGPPSQRSKDKAVMEAFMSEEGFSVICGATTARIAADYLGQELTIPAGSYDMVAPPHYEINGIDLVTEGVVTLNQLYHILEVDPSDVQSLDGVTEMYFLLNAADRVNFRVGLSQNPANGDLAFRQRGLAGRLEIVDLIVRKLEKMGKLVDVVYV